MSFFQNVFDQEYQGYLVLSDRKLSPTFKVAPNKNTQSNQVAWNAGPYDFSSNNILTFNFAWDNEYKNWASVLINVEGTTPEETTAQEVVEKLNNNDMFSSMCEAKVTKVNNGDSVFVVKKSKKQNAKMYFSNSGAETKLRFNKMAGVSELPEYFARHTIQNRNKYQDSAGMLIKLDNLDLVDQSIIENAGFNPAEMKEDWELLRGRSPGLFEFKKLTIDGSDRVTQMIEYATGAVEGDFAKKTIFTYSGSNKNPSQVFELPYVLTAGDLIVP